MKSFNPHLFNKKKNKKLAKINGIKIEDIFFKLKEYINNKWITTRVIKKKNDKKIDVKITISKLDSKLFYILILN